MELNLNADRNSDAATYQLSIDELDLVAGAGFWGDLGKAVAAGAATGGLAGAAGGPGGAAGGAVGGGLLAGIGYCITQIL